MNTLLTNRTNIFGRIGDFWITQVPEGPARDQARTLARMSEATSCTTDLEIALERMTGKNNNTYQYRNVPFNSADVLVLGGDLNLRLNFSYSDGSQTFIVFRRPMDYSAQVDKFVPLLTENSQAGNPTVIETESSQYLLVPVFDQTSIASGIQLDDLRNRYIVPIPFGVWPQTILAPSGVLVQGIDFVTIPGGIIMVQDPNLVFANGTICLQTMQRQASSWFDYTWQVDDMLGSGWFVSKYYRDEQTPAAFQAAIAEAAGLLVLPWDGVLLQINTFGQETYYVFDQGLLVANYPHTPLVIGNTYPLGTVVGNCVQVTSMPQGGTWTWFRQFDWSAGMPLDSLCPFPGIIVPDSPTTATAVSATAGKLHVQLGLQGNAASIARYWAMIKQNEIWSGNYLNAVVGLESEGDSTILNPLDLYWQYLLGSRAMIITLTTQSMGDYWNSRALAFIDREKPAGSIVIIQNA